MRTSLRPHLTVFIDSLWYIQLPKPYHMTIVRRLPLCLPTLIILQACQKDHNEPPTNPPTNCGTRLRMISSLDKGKSTTYFRTFNYDAGERVETFIDSIQFPSDNGGYVGVSSDMKRVA